MNLPLPLLTVFKQIFHLTKTRKNRPFVLPQCCEQFVHFSRGSWTDQYIGWKIYYLNGAYSSIQDRSSSRRSLAGMFHFTHRVTDWGKKKKQIVWSAQSSPFKNTPFQITQNNEMTAVLWSHLDAYLHALGRGMEFILTAVDLELLHSSNMKTSCKIKQNTKIIIITMTRVCKFTLQFKALTWI